MYGAGLPMDATRRERGLVIFTGERSPKLEGSMEELINECNSTYCCFED